jgi:hypothetical protein
MSDISARLRNGENRFLKWVYKQQYSGHPVISIPRHPDNIDALLADAADHIDALQDTLTKNLKAAEKADFIWQENYAALERKYDAIAVFADDMKNIAVGLTSERDAMEKRVKAADAEYRRGFEDGCAHMKEDYEAGERLDSRRRAGQ